MLLLLLLFIVIVIVYFYKYYFFLIFQGLAVVQWPFVFRSIGSLAESIWPWTKNFFHAYNPPKTTATILLKNIYSFSLYFSLENVSVFSYKYLKTPQKTYYLTCKFFLGIKKTFWPCSFNAHLPAKTLNLFSFYLSFSQFFEMSEYVEISSLHFH